MASTTDPRGADFDAATFRDAIHFAMNMGLPDDEAKRATFIFTEVVTYAVSDPAGQPYDWTEKPKTDAQKAPVEVPCSVRFVPSLIRSGSGTAFGTVNSPKAIITVLDTEYELTQGAHQVRLDDAMYTIDYVAPPEGLFDVTIYDYYCTAQDEV